MQLKLIRLGGHLILGEGGIHHAEIKTAICAGVPAASSGDDCDAELAARLGSAPPAGQLDRETVNAR